MHVIAKSHHKFSLLYFWTGLQIMKKHFLYINFIISQTIKHAIL